MIMKKNEDIYLIKLFSSSIKVGGSGDYASRLRKINREFISEIPTGKKSTPLELLKKFCTSSPKSGPNVRLIESLLAAISSRINDKLTQLRISNAPNRASFSSERSAFRKYMEFILDNVKAGKCRNNKLSINEEAIIANISQGHQKLESEDLISTFTSRLATQDRITGNKPFLPLALLGKILPKGELRQWARTEASNVWIHLQDKTVTVSEIVSLDIDTANSRVTVTLEDGTMSDVYNPPIHGSKERMKIRSIADTDIDHEPEIHFVLQSLNTNLPILNTITAGIHQARITSGVNTINSKNCDSIYEEVLKDESFIKSIESRIQDLMQELDLISTRHKLQLASNVWNRSDKKQSKKQSR